MPWYSGPTFLEHLETVPLARPATAQATRFSVQYVIRPDASFRGFAGQISSGTIRPGDPLIALPSGEQTQVESIITLDGLLSEAFSPMSVTLELANHIDLSRGDMLVAPDHPPVVSLALRCDGGLDAHDPTAARAKLSNQAGRAPDAG